MDPDGLVFRPARLIPPGLLVGPWQNTGPPAVIQQTKWFGLKSYSSDDLDPLFFSLYLYNIDTLEVVLYSYTAGQNRYIC